MYNRSASAPSTVLWAFHTIQPSSYIIKLCSRLFVLHCRSRPKYDNSRHFDPHFEEGRGGVEPWWMARWKARAEFLLSVIELLSLTVEALQAKRVKTRSLQEWVTHFEPKFQREGVVPGAVSYTHLTLPTILRV